MASCKTQLALLVDQIEKMKFRYLLLYLLLYLFSGLILIYFYQYQLNPDAVSYFGIAKKYANFDFQNAINGIWGPLLSWLLVPFLALNIQPIIAARFLALVTGSVLIIITSKFVAYFSLSPKAKIAIFASLLPIVLYFALSIITPDLLQTTILLGYLYTITNPKYLKGAKASFQCGILGGLAYLSKAYALPFFIIHYLIINCLHDQPGIIRRLAIGYFAFAILSLPWIYLISTKYAHPTFTTSFSHNYALEGPNNYVINTDILMPPPNKTATSVLEDVTYLPNYIPLQNWSPFESLDNFKLQIVIILRNLWRSFHAFEQFTIFSIVIIFYWIASLSKNLSKSIQNRTVFYTTLTLVIYPVAYLLFHVEPRYFWFSFVLILVLGIYTVDNLKIASVKKSLILAIFVISSVIYPVTNIYPYLNSGKDLYLAAKNLERDYGISHQNLASNTNRVPTIYLAYFTNSQYYGLAGNNLDKESLTNLLRSFNIDYYFYWHPQDSSWPLQASYVDNIIETSLPNLQIFKLAKLTH